MKTKIILAISFSFSMVMVIGQNFKFLDINDNKLIDRNEYALNAKIFENWDENNDNKLSRDEFVNALYKVFDMNNDKLISVSEWQVFTRLVQTFKKDKTIDFSKWDENNDHFIDKREFGSYLNNIFNSWDNNHDNKLSKSEFYNNSFQWWDLNNDGFISESEFNQIKEITKENKNFWDNLF